MEELGGIVLKSHTRKKLKPLTVSAFMDAFREASDMFPPPVPVAVMSQAMKDSIDANAGDKAPLTHIRCGADDVLREIRINNLIPDGSVVTTKMPPR